MKPNIKFIKYLIKNNFIRNKELDSFIEDNNNSIDLKKHICYTKGVIDDLIIIQSFIINKSYTTGIQSFEITWWDTFNVDTQEEIDQIEPITFWIHSGMSLRKNFFLFTDRFNLFKSTFIFDRISEISYRLFEIKDYLSFTEEIPINTKIFNNCNKFFKFKKINKKRNQIRKRKSYPKLHKLLLIIKKKCNFQNCLTRHYPKLLIEIDKVIADGNSTSGNLSLL